jgi:hypothetical protein
MLDKKGSIGQKVSTPHQKRSCGYVFIAYIMEKR